MKNASFSLGSRISSFGYALNGLKSLIKNEHNARIHLIAAISAITMGFLLKIKPVEWILILIVIGIVFITELLNTAVENAADLIDPDNNPGIGLIKDYAAAGVLVAAVTALITGCIIFIPYLVNLIS